MLADKLRAASVSEEPLFVEDVFSTYLYTGNGSTQSIANGIDLAGEGGLVWIKGRSDTGGSTHILQDTHRGPNNYISSNNTAAEGAVAANFSFLPDGFSQNNNFTAFNESNQTFASWTFRKAPKFFDVVTYTGTGANRTIAHDLGQAPGMIIVKDTSAANDWFVYHRSLGASYFMQLNAIGGQAGPVTDTWNGGPTDTTFGIGTRGAVNTTGNTYVAYLFAHDDSDEGIIQCGGFTTDGVGKATITLGWEPQYLLVKDTFTGNQYWQVVDNMRGLTVTPADAVEVYPGVSSAETKNGGFAITSTGFTVAQYTDEPYIYMAIRRGPMRVPTSGSQVYNAIARTGTGAAATVSGFNLPLDAAFIKLRGAGVSGAGISSRLTGAGYLLAHATAQEQTNATVLQTNPWDVMDGVKVGTTSSVTNDSSSTYINWGFRRAPGFMDVVCYTGTGVARTVAHNLGVVPELIITKSRSSGTYNWEVGYVAAASTGRLRLNANTQGYGISAYWDTIGAESYGVTTANDVNASAVTFVTYLFATCPGVSKVGSYTGTGTTLQIDCGFTSGARFVLIKRTDATGDWYVWDTARGIIAGNDPYLLLNSEAAEVTSTDYVDPYSAGFEISSTAPAAINASGGTFIFLAIA